MDAYSSRYDGSSFEAILEGFQRHRDFNVQTHRSKRIAVAGTEAGYLKNRAWFAAQKAREVSPGDKNSFVDHKVWSA